MRGERRRDGGKGAEGREGGRGREGEGKGQGRPAPLSQISGSVPVSVIFCDSACETLCTELNNQSINLFGKSRLPVRQLSIELAAHGDIIHSIKL